MAHGPVGRAHAGASAKVRVEAALGDLGGPGCPLRPRVPLLSSARVYGAELETSPKHYISPFNSKPLLDLGSWVFGGLGLMICARQHLIMQVRSLFQSTVINYFGNQLNYILN